MSLSRYSIGLLALALLGLGPTASAAAAPDPGAPGDPRGDAPARTDITFMDFNRHNGDGRAVMKIRRLGEAGEIKMSFPGGRIDNWRLHVVKTKGAAPKLTFERQVIVYEDSYVGPWEEQNCGASAVWNAARNRVVVQIPKLCELAQFRPVVQLGKTGVGETRDTAVSDVFNN